jgi:hypothetical protein
VVAPGMCSDGTAWIPAIMADGRMVPVCPYRDLVDERGTLRPAVARAAGIGAVGQETSLARETAPVWGTILAMAVVFIPVAGYLLWKEAQG